MKKHDEILKDLKKLVDLKREHFHPKIHKIHKKHKISKRTLLYIKEYGKNSHVARTIMKESFKVLLFACVLSSLGGFALNSIESLFLSIVPLVILLPLLNNMVGNYGTIVSSRFSTMLHEGKVRKSWWKTEELRELFLQTVLLTLIGAILSSVAALGITYFSPEGISLFDSLKVFLIVLIDMIFLANLLFFVAIFAGLYIYRKNEDPDNFLIPITTSVADFSNMVFLAILVVLFF